MMGSRQVPQGALFYEFSIEDHVPQDHLLRVIDRFLDLGDMRRYLAPFYSSTGRPSVDPELMIRMLIVGCAMGTRSERRLCEEVHLNLAYRWFCRLDLADPVPDHSTFSKNRHGRFHDSGLFRHLFEGVLSRCIAEGFVGGESFGADASLIKADASRYTKVGYTEWSAADAASPATQEYLDTLDDAAFGAATPVKPKAISPVDPAARFAVERVLVLGFEPLVVRRDDHLAQRPLPPLDALPLWTRWRCGAGAVARGPCVTRARLTR